jgi:hypothetical protein
MKTRFAAGLAAIGALALSAGAAHGVMVNFFQVSNNGPEDVSGQLLLDVTDFGGGVISFDLSNAGPVDSVITLFHIQDDGALFDDVVAVIDGAGVDFAEDTPPVGNLPEGNGAGFTSDWGAGATPPPAHNGVNEGEELELRLSLAPGKTFADVLASLQSGDLRAGLHVQSIGEEGASESYISNPPIPTPGTIAIGALAGIAGFRRRR